ncbi:hypothetical protein SteCoe_33410 [Stentor coeruleus]|uniref:Uncharacterized protein n=1 Tax=Stentor coeruleus TaxID=5963 RepID=A0A1R2AWY0_9CILI|nr:hypothetical protein SteCoe_33410 [Stentor coeruleus]
MLEVQGLKCKKYEPKRSEKKKSLQLSIFLQSTKPSSSFESPTKSPKLNSLLKYSTFIPTDYPDIILSSELPNIPFYMPKMLSKTPSPLRKTRTNFTKLRLNLYSPGQNQTPAEVVMQNNAKINKRVTKTLHKSLNIGKMKISSQRKSRDFHIGMMKKGISEQEVYLPTIIKIRKTIKGRF